jgi:hypothetical protein
LWFDRTLAIQYYHRNYQLSSFGLPDIACALGSPAGNKPDGGMPMQAVYCFPETPEEFWANKPEDVTPWMWLFHPLNPFRFTLWVAKFLNKILYYSQNRKGWTCFFQRTVARWLGISEQWLREIIRRLKLIGIIADQKIRKNRQYRVVDQVLRDATGGKSFGEKSSQNAATATSTMAYEEPPASYMQHQDNTERSRVSIIKADDRKSLDPLVEEFEKTTGTKFVTQRDGKTLAQLRQFNPAVVIVGILLSQLRVPKAKINSLAYCIPAIKEAATMLSITVKNEFMGKSIAHQLSEAGLKDYVGYLRGKLAKLQRE